MKKDHDIAFSICVAATVAMIILKIMGIIPSNIPWWIILSPIPLYICVITMTAILCVVIYIIASSFIELFTIIVDIFFRAKHADIRDNSIPIHWDPITKQLYGKNGPMIVEDDENE